LITTLRLFLLIGILCKLGCTLGNIATNHKIYLRLEKVKKKIRERRIDVIWNENMHTHTHTHTHTHMQRYVYTCAYIRMIVGNHFIIHLICMHLHSTFAMQLFE